MTDKIDQLRSDLIRLKRVIEPQIIKINGRGERDENGEYQLDRVDVGGAKSEPYPAEFFLSLWNTITRLIRLIDTPKKNPCYKALFLKARIRDDIYYLQEMFIPLLDDKLKNILGGIHTNFSYDPSIQYYNIKKALLDVLLNFNGNGPTQLSEAIWNRTKNRIGHERVSVIFKKLLEISTEIKDKLLPTYPPQYALPLAQPAVVQLNAPQALPAAIPPILQPAAPVVSLNAPVAPVTNAINIEIFYRYLESYLSLSTDFQERAHLRDAMVEIVSEGRTHDCLRLNRYFKTNDHHKLHDFIFDNEMKKMDELQKDLNNRMMECKFTDPKKFDALQATWNATANLINQVNESLDAKEYEKPTYIRILRRTRDQVNLALEGRRSPTNTRSFNNFSKHFQDKPSIKTRALGITLVAVGIACFVLGGLFIATGFGAAVGLPMIGVGASTIAAGVSIAATGGLTFIYKAYQHISKKRQAKGILEGLQGVDKALTNTVGNFETVNAPKAVAEIVAPPVVMANR